MLKWSVSLKGWLLGSFMYPWESSLLMRFKACPTFCLKPHVFLVQCSWAQCRRRTSWWSRSKAFSVLLFYFKAVKGTGPGNNGISLHQSLVCGVLLSKFPERIVYRTFIFNMNQWHFLSKHFFFCCCCCSNLLSTLVHITSPCHPSFGSNITGMERKVNQFLPELRSKVLF